MVRGEKEERHKICTFFQYEEKRTKQPHNCSHIVGGRCCCPGFSRGSSFSGVDDAMVVMSGR